jgi:hypothetical protein
MNLRLGLCVTGLLILAGPTAPAATPATKDTVPTLIDQTCVDCHDGGTHKGGLDLTKLPFDLTPQASRQRWIQIHDRIEKGEMPPDAEDLPPEERQRLLGVLSSAIQSNQ